MSHLGHVIAVGDEQDGLDIGVGATERLDGQYGGQAAGVAVDAGGWPCESDLAPL